MTNNLYLIEIACPSCRQKANFYTAELIDYNMHRQPYMDGKASCIHCGYNSTFRFTTKDYYYKIPIGDRTLYAKTFENLLFLRDYFKGKRKINDDPDIDFPRLFYKNRMEIIKKIDQIEKDHKKSPE